MPGTRGSQEGPGGHVPLPEVHRREDQIPGTRQERHKNKSYKMQILNISVTILPHKKNNDHIHNIISIII